jgi:hypothetical protein
MVAVTSNAQCLVSSTRSLRQYRRRGGGVCERAHDLDVEWRHLPRREPKLVEQALAVRHQLRHLVNKIIIFVIVISIIIQVAAPTPLKSSFRQRLRRS